MKTLKCLCGVLSAAALFFIMLLTLLDVSSRKLLADAVPSSIELTELLMVIVIFAALPLVSLQGEHVIFDSLDSFFKERFRKVQKSLVNAGCAILLALLSWGTWIKGANMIQYGDQTQQLGISLGHVVYLMSGLIALTAIAHAWMAVRPRVEANGEATEAA